MSRGVPRTVPRTALILSSGRTGTKFLARYLDANFEGVVARHEPPPSRRLRLASHAHLAGRLDRARLASMLRRARADVASIDASLYVESNPFLAGFVEVLDAAFDAPVVIHVVRDPREHARSSLNHGTGRGVKGLANHWLPFWYPDVRRVLALDHEPSWLERAAGVWRIFNDMLSEHGPRYASYRVVRYEDLFDERQSGLRAVCEALALAYPEGPVTVSAEDRINPGRLDVQPHWREWSTRDCRALQAICGPLMGRFGYGGEPDWIERVGRG